jgi:hypothetical protein
MPAHTAAMPVIGVKKLFGKDLMAGVASITPAVGSAMESGAPADQLDRSAMRL